MTSSFRTHATFLKPASERRGNKLKDAKEFYLKAKARTFLYVPYSLDSGQTLILHPQTPNAVCKADRLVYHSNLGWTVIKKKKKPQTHHQ